MKLTKSLFLYQLTITLVGLLLFLPFLGKVHLFDWDEINFAECAREMVVTGDFLNVKINFKPFWEKPPLFIWMQAISMKLFGINEFAARFPNAICGVITLLTIFNIGRTIYNEKFGLLWVISYLGSILPFFYFKSGIIDPWFNLFIFLSIYNVSLLTFKKTTVNRKWRIVLAGLFIGLAVLTKGPVGLLIYCACILIFWIQNRFSFHVTTLEVVLNFLVITFIGGFWFILQAFNGNFKIILDFINYQIELFDTEGAGHGGFLFYHFVILFFGVFPASILALRGFKPSISDVTNQRIFKTWMIILFFFVLILFTIVKTKILHYSSLCYFPLTYLAAFTLYKIHLQKLAWKKWNTILLIGIGVLFGLAVSILARIEKLKPLLLEDGVIKDKFAKANLDAIPDWAGWESIIGYIIITGVLIGGYFITKKKSLTAMITIYASAALFTLTAAAFMADKVETYTQRAAIDFYKAHQNEDCYFQTIGYRSYAHFFYGRPQPDTYNKMVLAYLNDSSRYSNNQGEKIIKPLANKAGVKAFYNLPVTDDYNRFMRNYLFYGNIDKPAYFVTRIDKKEVVEMLEKEPQIKELYRKNGFIFYVRRPSN